MMPRTRVTQVVLGAIAFGIASRPAHAQLSRGANAPDSIPRALVEALLRQPRPVGSNVEFTIGHVPASLEPFVYVPKNARVLGGVSSSSTTAVAMVVPGMSFEQARETYAREQPKLGWTPPPTFQQMRGWGFMPTPSAVTGATGFNFCHIGQSLDISPYPTPDGMQIVVAVTNFGGQCNLPRAAFAPVPGTPPNLLPGLQNPLGSSMSARECLGSIPMYVGTTGTSERLETTLSPVQLLDQFGKQLSDSGWSGGVATNGVRRTWTRPDSLGVRELTLTAIPIANTGCHDVSMSVRRVPKP